MSYLVANPEDRFSRDVTYITLSNSHFPVYLYKSIPLLAHLSRRLIGELIVQVGIRRQSSVVHRNEMSLLAKYTRKCQHFQTSSPQKPVEAKCYVEALGVGEMKVPSNGHGHMTKMAAMPIYGKNLKKSSSPEPKGQ